MSTVLVELRTANLGFSQFLAGFLYSHLQYPSRCEGGITYYTKKKSIPNVLQPFLRCSDVKYDEKVQILHEQRIIRCCSWIDVGFVQADVHIEYRGGPDQHLYITGKIKLTQIPIPFVQPLLERVIRSEFKKLRNEEIECARRLLSKRSSSFPAAATTTTTTTAASTIT